VSEPELLANAVIYLRVSTKEQAQKGGEVEGYSIPAQRAACTRKAESLGAHVIAEFVDAGESAKTSARPQLQAMLSRLSEGGIQYVIVHKLDRLARNRADDVMINLAITQAKARLVSVSEDVSETPSGYLVHGIMASINEFYSRNLATEAIKGMTQKVLRGGTVFMAPAGYANVAHTVDGLIIKSVEVDPERFALMRYAFEQYATGKYSLNTLADILEAKGLTYRPGLGKPARPIGPNHLHRLLHNPYYVGKIRWRGVEYQGSHPPLVSEELFNKVQDMLAGRAQSSERSYRTTHYLKGSLKCEQCKSNVTYAISTGRGGIRYPYFFCLGRHESRTDCELPFMQQKLLEDAITKHYQTEPMNRDELVILKKHLMHDLQIYQKKGIQEKRVLEQRIKKLNSERYRWAEKAMAGIVPDDIARERQDSLAKQLAQSREDLAKLTMNKTRAKLGIEKLCDLAEHCGERYRKGGPAIRKELNESLYEYFTVDTDLIHKKQPIVYSRRKPAFELLKTAQFSWAGDFNLTDAITNEETKRALNKGYIVFSLLNGSRVSTLEVESDSKLQPLIAEMLRWRTVIGTEYSQHLITAY
jgi:site-specific DNA recombinase